MNHADYTTLVKGAIELQAQGLHVPFLVWGSTGVGKTAGALQAARDLTTSTGITHSCTIVKVGQAEGAGDLVGAPITVTRYRDPFNPGDSMFYDEVELARVVDERHGKTLQQVRKEVLSEPGMKQERQRFAITDIWPTHGPGILVLDEINRAPADLLNSVFGLVQERHMELNGYTIPDDVIVLATANMPTKGYHGVQAMDAALVARFVHLTLTPDAEEVTAYLQQQSYTKCRTAAAAMRVIERDPAYLGLHEVVNPVIDQHVKPCPRQIDNFLKCCNVFQGSLLMEIAAGTIGPELAAGLLTSMATHADPVPGAQVFEDLPAATNGLKRYVGEDGYRHDLLEITAREVLAYLQGLHELNFAQAEALTAFMQAIPIDRALAFYRERLMPEAKAVALRWPELDPEAREWVLEVTSTTAIHG